jgi:hypothetical protein
MENLMNKTLKHLFDVVSLPEQKFEFFQLLTIACRAGVISDMEAMEIANSQHGVGYVPPLPLSDEDIERAERVAAGLPVEQRISEMSDDQWEAELDAAYADATSYAKSLGWDGSQDDYVRLMSESPKLAAKNRRWACLVD